MFGTLMPKKHLFPLYCDATIAVRRSGMKFRKTNKYTMIQCIVTSGVAKISCAAESSHYMILLLL